MKVVITRATSWKEVLNAARFTQRKEPIDKEPSTKFKKKIIKAEHSPLRCLIFNIDLYDIPYFVSVHLCRHVHAQPFVSTSRPDIDGSQPPREYQKKTDLVNMRLFVNAEEILNISRKRLCTRAEKETRNVWFEVVSCLWQIDPELANACRPQCFYRGFCPEFESCGLANTDVFPLKVNDYINSL